VLIDPTKVGSLALDPAAVCPSLNWGSWRPSSESVFSLSLLAEAMMPLKLRTTPDRNRSKQKHNENTIYRPRAIQEVI
jgi:hypothetical protein